MAANDLICSFFWAQPWRLRRLCEAVGQSSNGPMLYVSGGQQ
jgi:hypothetical protein